MPEEQLQRLRRLRRRAIPLSVWLARLRACITPPRAHLTTLSVPCSPVSSYSLRSSHRCSALHCPTGDMPARGAHLRFHVANPSIPSSPLENHRRGPGDIRSFPLPSLSPPALAVTVIPLHLSLLFATTKTYVRYFVLSIPSCLTWHFHSFLCIRITRAAYHWEVLAAEEKFTIQPWIFTTILDPVTQQQLA